MVDCAECGLQDGDVPRDELAQRLRALADEYVGPLREADQSGLARRRPEPSVWSAVEYTCHVLDVYRAQQERTLLAVEQDRPDFPASKISRDERVLQGRYNERDLDGVLEDLSRAAAVTADTLNSLTPTQWERTGVYHRPDPEEQTIEGIARKTLHEAVHHLLDVRREITHLREHAAPGDVRS